jgi:hypothetical protein
MDRPRSLLRSNVRMAKRIWGNLPAESIGSLRELTRKHSLSVGAGEIMLIDDRWYITHSGLLRIARRCAGIQVEALTEFCNPTLSRYAFKATLYRSRACKGFVGHGDADPSTVSNLVQGAEMRVAETRAVNRAIRKAYAIGICSVEELGSLGTAADSAPEVKKVPPQPANGHCWSSGPRVRDRLVQLIRQHSLDPELVKSYATDFCGTKTLKEATRAQVENFVEHLADWAEKDRDALLCQLNSYLVRKEKEGAA